MTRVINEKIGWKVLVNKLLKRALILLGIFLLMVLANLIPAINIPIVETLLGGVVVVFCELGIQSLKKYDPVLAEKFEWIFAKAVPVFIGWLIKIFNYED